MSDKKLGDIRRECPTMPLVKEVDNSVGRRTRRWIRRRLTSAERLVRSTSPQDLTDGIRKAGVRPGDAIMVHSSFGGMKYFRGTAMDALAAIIVSVGSEGTVVMPTFPFQGRSYDYLARHPLYDLRRTPAKTGLLCELLRLRGDAVRSLQPSHPVAAVGRFARRITAGYEHSVTPFDVHSPWHEMSELDAWILNVGLKQQQLAITHYHYVEEALQALMPVPLYWPEPFDATVRDAEGNERVVKAWAHHPNNRKDYGRMLEWHRRAGVLHHHRQGAIDIWACRARELLKSTELLAGRGCTVFSDAGWDTIAEECRREWRSRRMETACN